MIYITNFNELIYRFVPQMLMFVGCFLAITVFIIGDYYSGTTKARMAGEKILSEGMRRTVTKAVRYITVLFGCNLIDLVQMLAIHVINTENDKHFFVVPIFSIVATMFNCYVEYKSIRESYEDKRKRFEKEALTDIGKAVDYIIQKKHELESIND